jgi:hypothetical protein
MGWVRDGSAAMAMGLAAAGCLGSGSLTGTGGAAGTGGAGGSSCQSFQWTAPGPDTPREILVVLDRSATMADDANGMPCSGGCGASSKWSLLATAVEGLVAANPQVSWGLAFYGGDDVCSVSPGATVEAAPRTFDALAAAIAASPPGGSNSAATPAIFNASNYLAALPDLGPRYIMLVTDGQESCATAPTTFDITYLEEALSSTAIAGFPTFVVGPPAGSNAASIATLDDLAINGGIPNPGPTSYYAPGDLATALSKVALGEGTPCRIPLSVAIDYYGTALSSVTLTRPDGTVVDVPQDPTAGWSVPPFYHGDSTPEMIDISGELCQGLKAGAFRTVTVTYSCVAP